MSTPTSHASGSARESLVGWGLAAGLGVVLFAGATGAFVAALWLVMKLVDDTTIQLVAAFVFGLAYSLAIVATIVAAFAALRLTSPQKALGLPEGSIRAIIAITLILVFVIMSIYLVERVYTDNLSTDEANNAATQLLATVGTLVAAVSAFYFGTGAVKAGAEVATRVATATEAALPAASTKGSALVEDRYVLDGFVNPRGLETRWYFDYGTDTGYGSTSRIGRLAPTDAETLVRSEPLAVEHGSHFRLVAFNETGMSYGDDATVTDKRPGSVDVPNVVGKSQTEATQQIEAAKLVAEVTLKDTSDSADVGNVIDQDPEADASVAPGSTVTLTGGQAEPPPP
jgi:PASTA domain